MPASYPGSIKTFTVKIDGVDYVMAAHVNDIQDEVTAIETALRNGPLGIGVASPLGQLSVFGGVAPSGNGLGIKLLGQAGGSGGDGGTVLIGAGENGAGGVNGEIQFGTASPASQALSLVFGKFTASGDFYSVPLTDYSNISSIVGWSSFTLKQIFYKKVGKTVWVQFLIAGTSNNTSVTFTLPFTSISAGATQGGPIAATDNGIGSANAVVVIGGGSATVSCYQSIGGALWTASGVKEVFGQFSYEAA